MESFFSANDNLDVLRKEAASRRDQTPDRNKASEEIWKSLRSLSFFDEASQIFAYANIRSEVETTKYIFEDLVPEGYHVAFPYCVENRLRFCQVTTLQDLSPGSYSILEPTKKLQNEEARHRTVNPGDIILVPGLAFSKNGERIGYGAGYYDRFLERLPTGIRTVGLAFSCQVYETLPTKKTDVPLSLIITETDVFYRNG